MGAKVSLIGVGRIGWLNKPKDNCRALTSNYLLG